MTKHQNIPEIWKKGNYLIHTNVAVVEGISNTLYIVMRGIDLFLTVLLETEFIVAVTQLSNSEAKTKLFIILNQRNLFEILTEKGTS